MAVSLVVIGRVFEMGSYLLWGILSVPGVLYVMARLKSRSVARIGEVRGS